MDRFEYSTPYLKPNEEIICKETNVRIYEGSEKSGYEKGELWLTPLRFLWKNDNICLDLPLQYVLQVEDSPAGTFAFTSSHKITVHLSEPSPNSRAKPSPAVRSSHNYIKFSFRDGLKNSNIVELVQSAIAQKQWENGEEFRANQANTSNATSPTSPNKVNVSKIQPRWGIVGIERGLQEQQKATDQSIAVAFRDLDKLMAMAQDMVKISQVISRKITEKQGDITEDETVKFKSYLMSLGIDDPVTRDDFKSDDLYYYNLSNQIADVLQEPVKEVGGMMTLADAYCRINRARGLELLSPEDMLRACQLLVALNKDICLHKFESGVMVLQLSALSDESVVDETEDILLQVASISAEELAQTSGVSVLLARERLLLTEKHGKACRDDSMEGLRFYPNRFLTEGN